MSISSFTNNQGVSSIVYNDKWENVTKKFPDRYFDLLIADIPYGLNVGKMAYLTEKKKMVRQKNGSKLSPSKNNKSYTKKDWDLTVPGQEYFDEVRRISNHQIIFGVEYVDWEGLGSGRIKWNKGVAENVSFKGYELAYCSMIDHTHEIDLLWSGMMQAKSLSEPMTMQGNKKLNEKRNHPCHKPSLLYRRLLLDFAEPGLKICDTHLGDGMIRIECDNYNCEFVGIETDPEYFNGHLQFWEPHASKLKLF